MTIHKIIFRLPAPLIIITLWILSSQSKLPQPETSLPGLDKAAHFIAYAALGAAFTLWFSRESPRERKRNILLSLCLASFCGIVDELHQYFVPGRSCDIFDWIADTLGALAGATMFLRVMKIVGEKSKNERFSTHIRQLQEYK